MIDVCLTLEPGFSTLEDLTFLDSANSVHLLGSVYSPKDINAIKQFSRSLIWLTYRKNWPAPIGGFDGPTSDRGWGCMIRVGQMLLAQTLVKLHLGADWCWANELERQQTDSEKFQAYRRLLKMFQDKRTAQFSIHQIAQFGVSEGKPIGEWLGPNSMAQVLKKIVVYDEWSNLVVHVAMDNVLISDDVRMMASLSYNKKNNDGNDKPSQNNAISPWIRPLLLIVPLRLGLSAINQCYSNAIIYFKLPQSVGILGGRPRHAVYFYGTAGKKLLYLDPHICQEFIDIDTPPPSDSHSDDFGDDVDQNASRLITPPSTACGKLDENARTNVSSSSPLMEFPSPSSTMDTSVLDDFLCHRSTTAHPSNGNSNNNVDELFLPRARTTPVNHRPLLSATSSPTSSASSSLLNQHNHGEAISFPATSSSVSKISSRNGGAEEDIVDCPSQCYSSSTTSEQAEELSSSSVEPSAALDSSSVFIETSSFADVVTLTQPHYDKWTTECSSADGTNDVLDDNDDEGGDDVGVGKKKQHHLHNGRHQIEKHASSSNTFEMTAAPATLTSEKSKCDDASTAATAFDDASFHCPYILTMDFKSLDPSLALGFLTRTMDEYEDLVHRLKTSILPSSSPPLFEILDSRPKGWPKFTPFESEFFHDDSLDIKEYADLLYDSDEPFELLE